MMALLGFLAFVGGVGAIIAAYLRADADLGVESDGANPATWLGMGLVVFGLWLVNDPFSASGDGFLHAVAGALIFGGGILAFGGLITWSFLKMGSYASRLSSKAAMPKQLLVVGIPLLVIGLMLPRGN